MKKINQIVFGLTLLAAVAFTSSCKKTTEVGPVGANGSNGANGTNGTDGKDGSRFPYKEVGTSLNLMGNFYSDDASFDQLITLSFYEKLEESTIRTSAPQVRTEAAHRTSADGMNDYFDITRYDSLGNTTLTFNIENDYNNGIYVNSFYFNAKTNITETSYRNIYTTYYGGGPARVSGPYDQEGSLDDYDLNNDGNSFAITNWNYDRTTHVLTFDYSGQLTGDYNSSGNNLTVSGSVKATVRTSSLRVAQ